jgi:3-methyladenine DNA glycosylase AlkD
MNLDDVMSELAAKANANHKRTYLRHGAVEPLFGVRISDLKLLHKKLKGRQDLALELYATKNTDAMYLAGLIADGAQMTPRQLDQWAAGATWHMIAGSTVPWVAAEHPRAIEIARKWIDSPKELVATAGWATLGSVVATVPDEELPIGELGALLDRCVKEIKSAPNRVRYVMNDFVICCGTYVQSLAEKAIATARKIGVVDVDLGDTACQVPEAEAYIHKSRRGAPVAPKRKSTRC